jgi:hypothetical protein
MFTGLIQGPGKVLSVTGRHGEGSGNRETRLEIGPDSSSGITFAERASRSTAFA